MIYIDFNSRISFPLC